MLRLNDHKVNPGKFPDGTLLLKQHIPTTGDGTVTIDWWYESDDELFTLFCLKRHLEAAGIKTVHLAMPYIPHARMDRVKDDDDVFTLKYFAEIINSLSFDSVTVLDPHSSVSEALIERIHAVDPSGFIQRAITSIKDGDPHKELLMFYPDEGAMKRYSGMFNAPYAFGIKDRDWKTGKIRGLKIMDEDGLVDGSDVLIVDDICSRGGTFYHAAHALKAHGAGKIYLFVTHCENTILKGEVLSSGLIERVYTTDSIFTAKHRKVEVFKL